MTSSKGRGKQRRPPPADTAGGTVASRPAAPGAPPRSSRRLVLLCAVALAGLGLLAWRQFTRDDPQQLLAEARRIWRENPQGADERLQRALVATHGQLPAAHLLRCRLLLADTQAREAAEYLQELGGEVAGDPSGLLELAEDARAAQEWPLAALAAAQIPSAAAEYPAALRLLVEAESRSGQWMAALDHARLWQQREPASSTARLATAQVLRRQLQVVPAVEACREAVRLAPEGSDEQFRARRELVELLITVRDGTGARQEFDRLIAAAGRHDELDLVEAYVLRFEGRLEEARRRTAAVLQRLPDSVEARFLDGLLCFDGEDYDGAARILADLVARRPTHKEARYKLAQALQRLGRGPEAQLQLDASARLTRLADERLHLQGELARNPGDRRRRERLVAVCRELGLDEEAAYWERAAVLGVDSP